MKYLALSALLGLSLNAATISFGPISTTPSFDPGDQTSYTQLLFLPQFNPALGTLTGVEIDVDTQINKSGSLVNNGTNAATLTYLYGATTISVSGLGVAHTQTASGAFTGGESFPNVPGSGGSVPITALQEMDLNNLFTPGTAGFEGGGTIQYTVTADSSLLTGCGGGTCASSIATLMGAQITVTYTYDELPTNDVPEPTTFALLGLGLAGFGLMRRRKN